MTTYTTHCKYCGKKYEVKFYKPTRISRFVCTRTYASCVKFAISRFLRGYGLFTIKRIK